METLTSLGFKALNDEELNEINVNPLFKPILIRYHGLGWYQVIIRKCRTHKYRVIPMGGSSEIDREVNLRDYRNMNTQGDFYSLEDLARKIQNNPGIFTC